MITTNFTLPYSSVLYFYSVFIYVCVEFLATELLYDSISHKIIKFIGVEIGSVWIFRIFSSRQTSIPTTHYSYGRTNADVEHTQ